MEIPYLKVEGDSVFFDNRSSMIRLNTDGSDAEELPWSGGDLESTHGYTVAGDDIYWTNRSGELWHMRADAPFTPRLMDQHGPYDDDDYEPLVMVDDDAVYWTAAPDGTPSYYDEGPFNLYRTCR